MSITVSQISDKINLQKAFDIRIVVFVDEQKVPMEEEIDDFEHESIHLLACENMVPCGACRWRFTDKGIKLERFAVLKEFRGKGIGAALVQACLNNIFSHPKYYQQTLYLNAQLEAMPLYTKFGFQPVGNMFLECDIKHIQMILKE